MDLLATIRTVPDFPKPGIQFKDITTLIANPEAFRFVMAGLEQRFANRGITKVVGIESRGFIFGAALATRLGVGFVPIRKIGKLPADTIRRSYSLEYGEATVELHRDALTAADRVVVIDDLLATGGTAKAACELVAELGATIEEAWFLVELAFLPGRKALGNIPVHAEVVVGEE